MYKEAFIRINRQGLTILTSFIIGFLFNIGDQAIIGRSSLEEFTGVSIVGNILYAITGSLGVLSLSLNIIGSKYIGMGKIKEYEKLLNTAISLSLFIGVLFQISVILFGRTILNHFFHMEGVFLERSYDYLSIASLGVVLNMLIFILSAYFKSSENVKKLLPATLLACSINLVIDYILVFGKLGFPRLGSKGAAIGTVIGLLVNLLFLFIIFIKKSGLKVKISIDFTYLKLLFKRYIPLLGQDFIESTLFVIIVQALLAKQGVLIAGTYGLLIVVIDFIILPIYAYSSAASTLISKANGEKRVKQVKALSHLTVLSLIIVVALLGSILYLGRSLFLGLITNQSELINHGLLVLKYAILTQFFNITNNIYKSSLNALGKERWVFLFSFGTSFFSILVIYLFLNFLNLGLKGLFIAFTINYIVLSLGYYLKFSSSVRDWILSNGLKLYKY